MSSDCYVVFTKAKTLGGIRKFLHPDISHCYVIWKDGNQWLKYDSTIDDVDICAITGRGDILAESIVVKVKRRTIEGIPFVANTCVGSVKRFIGMKDKFILTPYQLYKRLTSWEY